MVALDVRIALAAGETSRARERLSQNYDSTPSPRSIELDLVRLLFLLSEQPSEVAGWIDQVATKHGAYARRRAEAVAIATMNRSGETQTVDASLVAAQGRDRLRRGDTRRAAELLTVAAQAQRDPSRAIEHAVQAAAAWRASGDNAAASTVLTETSMAHAAADSSAAVHLQGLLLSPTDPDMPSRLETHLRTWPSSETAIAATDWLVKLRLAGGDRIGAAAAMTQTLPSSQAFRIDRAAELWRSTLDGTSPDRTADLSARFIAASKFLSDQPALRTFCRDTAAMVCDVDGLNQLSESVANAPAETAASKFLADVFAMRIGRRIKPDAALPTGLTPSQTGTLMRRLMADGRRDRELRIPIARWLDRWFADEPADQTATRQIWMGNVAAALSTLETYVREDGDSADRMREAGELLASSDDAVAVIAAVAYYDRLAAGLPQGGPTWHDAKLASINLLRLTGRVGEADKRAKYILLTASGLDDSLRQRYESFTQR
jgi:hypothetical protein